MDTREKIIDLSEFARRLSAGRWTVVTALFDPLTAVQAKRISAFAQSDSKLAAIVLKGEKTLLTAEARAVLIAALRDVDLVAIADEEWRAHIPRSERIRVIEDPQGEAARTSEFIQFVVNRQQSV